MLRSNGIMMLWTAVDIYLPSQTQNPWIQSEMKSSLPKFKLCHISFYIITISMRALWLVNQLWVVVPVNPRKNSASTELLYKSNRPQVSMVYELINHLGCWYSAARGLQILLVFYQHPAWFSKFSAPTIAFLAFLLAKKLRIWANSRSFTSYGK